MFVLFLVSIKLEIISLSFVFLTVGVPSVSSDLIPDCNPYANVCQLLHNYLSITDIDSYRQYIVWAYQYIGLYGDLLNRLPIYCVRRNILYGGQYIGSLNMSTLYR